MTAKNIKKLKWEEVDICADEFAHVAQAGNGIYYLITRVSTGKFRLTYQKVGKLCEDWAHSFMCLYDNRADAIKSAHEHYISSFN